MGGCLWLGIVANAGVIMDISYALTPFLAWLAAGVLKFVINSVKSGQPAFSLIGYGGLPSNHSAIVSSMATIIALKEGIGHPAFGLAVTVAFIVVLDAHSLRRQVGRQAETINKLLSTVPDHQLLRERMGHTRLEIATGIIVGISIAVVINAVIIYL